MDLSGSSTGTIRDGELIIPEDDIDTYVIARSDRRKRRSRSIPVGSNLIFWFEIASPYRARNDILCSIRAVHGFERILGRDDQGWRVDGPIELIQDGGALLPSPKQIRCVLCSGLFGEGPPVPPLAGGVRRDVIVDEPAVLVAATFGSV